MVMVRGFRIERLTGEMDRRFGRTHEIFSPDGYRFDGGEHSLICDSWQEALDEAQMKWVEPCPPECPCKQE